MSFLPEKNLAFSPSLAATIGLEEAILLHVLSDFITYNATDYRNGFNWLEISGEHLETVLSFWQPRDIQRIIHSLKDKGIVLVESAPYVSQRRLKFALNEQQIKPSLSTAIQPTPPPSRGNSIKTIANTWQPDRELLRQLAQYNIPETFIFEMVPEFVTYWTERNEPSHSWGSKFISQCLRKWRLQQSREHKINNETAISRNWQPSADAIDILVRQAAINSNFIADAIPEFVLYWHERGEKSSTWNSRFIAHVKRQWARFTSAIELDSDPRPMTQDWQPKPELFEVLALANIDKKFAEQLLPEFILFWQDTGRAEASWNTKFLQQIKRQWAQKSNTSVVSQTNEKGRRASPSGNARSRSAVEQLTDRSWFT